MVTTAESTSITEFQLVPRSPVSDPFDLGGTRVRAPSAKAAWTYLKDAVAGRGRQSIMELKKHYQLVAGAVSKFELSLQEWIMAVHAKFLPAAVVFPVKDELDELGDTEEVPNDGLSFNPFAALAIPRPEIEPGGSQGEIHMKLGEKTTLDVHVEVTADGFRLRPGTGPGSDIPGVDSFYRWTFSRDAAPEASETLGRGGRLTIVADSPGSGVLEARHSMALPSITWRIRVFPDSQLVEPSVQEPGHVVTPVPAESRPAPTVPTARSWYRQIRLTFLWTSFSWTTLAILGYLLGFWSLSWIADGAVVFLVTFFLPRGR